jgi:hypothetical protein
VPETVSGGKTVRFVAHSGRSGSSSRQFGALPVYLRKLSVYLRKHPRKRLSHLVVHIRSQEYPSMPRDASGTYTLPIAPFVPLTLAKSADMNTALTDIADALTDSQSRVSPTPAQGDLNMNGHNILNLGEVVGDLIATDGVYAEGRPVGAGGGGPFGFQYDGVHFIWYWGVTGYYDAIDPADGKRYWAGGAGAMTLDSGGNLFVPGAVSAASSSVTGTLTAGTLTAGTLTAGTLTATGNVAAGLDLTVARDAYVTGHFYGTNVNLSGALGASSITTGSLTASGNVNAGGDLHVNNNAYVTGALTAANLNATGNVVVSGALSANSATLGPTSVLGNLSATGTITATKEIHAGGKGIYYDGLYLADHAIGFHWTGAVLDAFVDGNYVGHIGFTGLAREAGPDPVAALQDRIAALEARLAAAGIG